MHPLSMDGSGVCGGSTRQSSRTGPELCMASRGMTLRQLPTSGSEPAPRKKRKAAGVCRWRLARRLFSVAHSGPSGDPGTLCMQKSRQHASWRGVRCPGAHHTSSGSRRDDGPHYHCLVAAGYKSRLLVPTGRDGHALTLRRRMRSWNLWLTLNLSWRPTLFPVGSCTARQAEHSRHKQVWRACMHARAQMMGNSVAALRLQKPALGAAKFKPLPRGTGGFRASEKRRAAKKGR